jgi:hypothetical protein
MSRRKIKKVLKHMISLILMILNSVVLLMIVYGLFYAMAVFVNYLVPLP